MLTIEQIRQALQDRRTARVAAATGLSYQTVYNIRRGNNGDIAYSTAEALSNYLEKDSLNG